MLEPEETLETIYLDHPVFQKRMQPITHRRVHTQKNQVHSVALILCPWVSLCSYPWEGNAFRQQTNSLDKEQKLGPDDNILSACSPSSFPHCPGQHLSRAEHLWAHSSPPLEGSAFKSRAMPRTTAGPPKPQTLPIAPVCSTE